MTSKDLESSDFDPFKERKLTNPTSDLDTLTHLLKASLGTGILAMPKAFKNVGLLLGIFLTMFVAIVCTHCAYILVKCAHVLYRRKRKTLMTYPEVGEAALEYGPQALKRYATCFRVFILVSLFITHFGIGSVYTVIIAKNLVQFAAHYMKVPEESLDTRLCILGLLIPLILISWVRNLKFLAPASTAANCCMGLGLLITLYYLVGTGKLKTDQINNMLFKGPLHWPEFFSLTIFAIEAIGVIMPLENAMKTPRSMLGVCGVLSKGMSGVTLVYIIIGFLGYLRYGESVKDSITLDLDITQIPAQIVKIAIAIAVFCTYALQFFVCIEIMWKCYTHRFTNRPVLADYIQRTIMVTGSVLLAIAVPQIAPFMGVIGAFCYSVLGLMAPAFIEVITYWHIGFGPTKYILWKNVLVLLFGLFALIFGTKDAIMDIIKAYST